LDSKSDRVTPVGFIARVVVVVARGRRPSIGPRTRDGVVLGIVVGIGIIARASSNARI